MWLGQSMMRAAAFYLKNRFTLFRKRSRLQSANVAAANNWEGIHNDKTSFAAGNVRSGNQRTRRAGGAFPYSAPSA